MITYWIFSSRNVFSSTEMFGVKSNWVGCWLRMKTSDQIICISRFEIQQDFWNWTFFTFIFHKGHLIVHSYVLFFHYVKKLFGFIFEDFNPEILIIICADNCGAFLIKKYYWLISSDLTIAISQYIYTHLIFGIRIISF